MKKFCIEEVEEVLQKLRGHNFNFNCDFYFGLMNSITEQIADFGLVKINCRIGTNGDISQAIIARMEKDLDQIRSLGEDVNVLRYGLFIENLTDESLTYHSIVLNTKIVTIGIKIIYE